MENSTRLFIHDLENENNISLFRAWRHLANNKIFTKRMEIYGKDRR